jgi:hypothetical protein
MNYKYPWWGELIGWFLALSSMLCIPGYAIYKYLNTTGDFSEVNLLYYKLTIIIGILKV